MRYRRSFHMASWPGDEVSPFGRAPLALPSHDTPMACSHGVSVPGWLTRGPSPISPGRPIRNPRGESVGGASPVRSQRQPPRGHHRASSSCLPAQQRTRRSASGDGSSSATVHLPSSSSAPLSDTPDARALSLGRRAAAAAAAAAAAVLGASFGVPHPADAALDPVQNLTRRGMAKFVQNDVEGSIADFDLIIDADPNRAPYLWQRGLSLYYADRFTDGAAQFRTDVAVNPNDTEEAIWAFLCEARTLGFERARERLLKVGPDPRAYMREAYALFSGEGSEAALRAVGERGPAEEFYSLLYVGLWREARGEAEPAREAMVGAVKSLYGQRSGDYMAGLAAVHCKRRGWEVA